MTAQKTRELIETINKKQDQIELLRDNSCPLENIQKLEKELLAMIPKLKEAYVPDEPTRSTSSYYD